MSGPEHVKLAQGRALDALRKSHEGRRRLIGVVDGDVSQRPRGQIGRGRVDLGLSLALRPRGALAVDRRNLEHSAAHEHYRPRIDGSIGFQVPPVQFYSPRPRQVADDVDGAVDDYNRGRQPRGAQSRH